MNSRKRLITLYKTFFPRKPLQTISMLKTREYKTLNIEHNRRVRIPFSFSNQNFNFLFLNSEFINKFYNTDFFISKKNIF